MIERDNFRYAAGKVLQTDDVDQVLSNSFFSARALGSSDSANCGPRPNHYKVICISIYNEDLVRLDEMVTKLKLKGLTKVSRSALIRFALSEVDLDRVPKGL